MSNRFFSIRPLRVGGLLLLATLIALGGLSANALAADGPKWREGRILVQPKAGVGAANLNQLLKGQGGRSVGRLRNLPIHEVAVPAKAEHAVARALARNPHIAFAEPDYLVEPADLVPNDPRYGNAWHLPKIESPRAWELSQGAGIVIAILDTGVDAAHPDLVGKLLPGWNAVDGSLTTSDIHGHGTSVAGTAAAATDNGIGVAAVGWDAQLLPVRVSNRTDGYAYFSDIARGLSWATDQGAHVANISYGVTGSAAISNAANYMRSKGGLVVVAAGNESTDPGLANNPAMITVSATTSSDTKASWSNYGTFIDVAAPGASIQTTRRGGGYGNSSGTSFASPVTAGVVALIMAANPLLTPDQVEQILKDSADDVSGVGWHPNFGAGRVNAGAAVELAFVAEMLDTTPPEVVVIAPTVGETVSGQVLVQTVATDDVGVTAVTLLADGIEIGTLTSAPYEFVWDSTTVGDGTATLTVEARDAAGNQGIANRQVQVANSEPESDVTPPSVRFMSPADGATVRNMVQIRVQATDDEGVTSLKLYRNGQLVGVSSNGTLNHNWQTRQAATGPYDLLGVAEDAAGNRDEARIRVFVSR